MASTRQFTLTTVALAALTAMFGLTAGVQADILVSYDFTSGDLSPTATATGFTASDMGRSAYLDNPEEFTTDFVWADGYQVRNSEAESLSYGSYFEFTVTPDSGSYSLDSLSFDTAYLTYAGGVDTTTYFVRWSGDSYASNLGSFAESSQDIANPTYTWTTRDLDLSGAAYQDLSGPVTFRIYMWNTFNGSVHHCAFDNVELATIPEPATMVLLSMGGLAVLRRRRR